MGEHTITAVIPTFNRAERLERAVRSVLTQSYTDLIVHVFDNACSDRTENFMRRMVAEDSRVRYTRHQRNLGAAENFSQGFAAVDTPYFAFLADDDYVLPGFYRLAMQDLSEIPSAVFWSGMVRWTDLQGEPVGAQRPWSRQGLMLPTDAVEAMLTEAFILWTSVIFVTDAAKSVGLDHSVGLVSDMDFLFRVAATGPIIFRPETVAVAEASTETSSGFASFMETWQSWQRTITNLHTSLPDMSLATSRAVDRHMSGFAWRAAVEAVRAGRQRDAISAAWALRQSGNLTRAAMILVAAGAAPLLPFRRARFVASRPRND